MDRVSVIIPNWNGRLFLEPCLRSLAQQVEVDLEVIVVDNGSRDDSVGLLRQSYPWVKVIALPENIGFSGAVNAGIRGCDAPYVLVLNNDTELDPGCVAALWQALEADAAVGAAGPKILDFNDRTLLVGIGDGYTFAGIPSSIGFLERDTGQFDRPIEIFSPSGCAALYRRSALDAVGSFDEEFFAYYEDVDLGFRLQMAALRCVYAPRAIVYHVGSGSTGGGTSPFKIRQMAQNMIGLAVKNLHASVLFRVLPFWVIAQALLMIRLLVFHSRDRAGHLGAYCAGLGSGIRLLPLMLARRRQNLGRSKLFAREVHTMIGRSEKMILTSLLRSRGPQWWLAPAVRLYLRLSSGAAL